MTFRRNVPKGNPLSDLDFDEEKDDFAFTPSATQEDNSEEPIYPSQGSSKRTFYASEDIDEEIKLTEDHDIPYDESSTPQMTEKTKPASEPVHLPTPNQSAPTSRSSTPQVPLFTTSSNINNNNVIPSSSNKAQGEGFSVVETEEYQKLKDEVCTIRMNISKYILNLLKIFYLGSSLSRAIIYKKPTKDIVRTKVTYKLST